METVTVATPDSASAPVPAMLGKFGPGYTTPLTGAVIAPVGGVLSTITTPYVAVTMLAALSSARPVKLTAAASTSTVHVAEVWPMPGPVPTTGDGVIWQPVGLGL